MPRKKKEEIEETGLEAQTVEETKISKHSIPVIDYRVVSTESVPRYLHKGYVPVGGIGNKYNCWYQAVMKQWTVDVQMTNEEFESFDWEKFNDEHRGAEL